MRLYILIHSETIIHSFQIKLRLQCLVASISEILIFYLLSIVENSLAQLTDLSSGLSTLFGTPYLQFPLKLSSRCLQISTNICLSSNYHTLHISDIILSRFLFFQFYSFLLVDNFNYK